MSQDLFFLSGGQSAETQPTQKQASLMLCRIILSLLRSERLKALTFFSKLIASPVQLRSDVAQPLSSHELSCCLLPNQQSSAAGEGL